MDLRKTPDLIFIVIMGWLLLPMVGLCNAYQEVVEGIVCEDSNHNGACDPGEPGIAGVMVSNQREVVLTDENGYYRLPIEEEMIVFISKPAGYEWPLSETNLPRFYYIYQPNGSPQLEYPGVEPTGPLPSLINFALIPTEEKRSFKAVVLADPTLREQTIPYFRDGIITEVAHVDADLILVLGDMMSDDLSFFPRYNEMMSVLGKPVVNIVGNHDVNFDMPNEYAKETFKSYYGPTYFSFTRGEVHFIVLDNIEMMEDGGSLYQGALSEQQFTWLQNNLEHVPEEQLIVILAHIPLYSMDTDARSNNTVNRDQLFKLLENHDRILFLSGHRHVTFHHFLGEELDRKNPNSVHHVSIAVSAGGWWRGPINEFGIPVSTQNDGVPNGYYIFEFEGNTYRERFKAAGLDRDYQMRIEAPAGSLTKEELQQAELIVNVFNGSARSQVWFRLNDSDEWQEMERQEVFESPFAEESEWLNPYSTNHIWKAELPVLEPGAHLITVRTQDMYGHKFIQSKIVEINKK